MRASSSLAAATAAVSLWALAACGSPEADGGGGANVDVDVDSGGVLADAHGDDSLASDSVGGDGLGTDAGQSSDAAADSASDDDSAAADTAGASCPGGPGCPCSANAECDAALCIDTPEGKQCARFCVDTCPGGFKCSPVAGSGGDTLTICVPEFGQICNPCTASQECLALGATDPACVDLGPQGAFCGLGCASDGACPAGWSCQEATSVEGAVSKQCVRTKDPATGKPAACTCSAAAMAKKLTTACYVEVKDDKGELIGTCAGLRKCTKDGLGACVAPPAQVEVCDGADNDCDGKIDEQTCDDDNACTTDLCDPAKAAVGGDGCGHAALQAPCDDGNACTDADVCLAGVCAAGKVKSCDDGNPCTKDSCDLAKGCSQTADDGAPCDDENPCTIGDICKLAGCTAGKLKECNVAEPCVVAKCSLVTGQCQYVNKNDGLPCDDATACTTGDACKGGVCGGKVKDCDDGNPCTDDSCDGAKGCQYVKNTSPCSDGDACTTADLCGDGVCVGAKLDPAAACKDGNACTDDACDPKLGCVHPANGADCDDGNPCTLGDICQGGGCQGGSNLCECEGDSDCAKKEDGNLCNGTLLCDKSKKPYVCAVNPKTVVSCPDNGGPCLDNQCNKQKGGCELVTKNEGQPCDADGSVCTVGDVCAGGKCKVGAAVSCDDGNPCTDDSCDAQAGCKHAANTALCDDGQGCTVGDACDKGGCVPGKPKACDDGDVCTDDSCDKAKGACAVKPIAGCGGFCAKDADCDDKSDCTEEGCLQGKCLVKYLSKACDDGSACTANDACGGGQCAGKPLDCDDGKPCTKDSCNPSFGCAHAAATGPCDDGDACTEGESCANSACGGGKAKACDDGDACTKDACEAASGQCKATAVVGCGGNCAADKDCDDANPCTKEGCGGDGKCVVTFESGPCDDNNPCTANDFCDKGLCGLGSGWRVATLAGAGVGGHQDGLGDAALVHDPSGLAVLPSGALLLADAANHRIRKVGLDGKVSAFAGSGKAGWQDGSGPLVQFKAPEDVAVDKAGVAIVADTGNHRLRRVDAGGAVVTLAGSGSAGDSDGKGLAAAFSAPRGVAVTPGGVAYVVDTGNHRLRRVAADGTVVTLAGGAQGFLNGMGKAAQFSGPIGVALSPQGDLLVADAGNHRLRRVSPAGLVTTLVGADPGSADGSLAVARLNQPTRLAVDALGAVWIADAGNFRIRRLDIGGTTATIAGNAKGFGDGAAATAAFGLLGGVAVHPGGTVVIADAGNQRLRALRNHDANCLIGGVCYSDGAANPAQTCQVCAGAKAATAWTTLAAAKPCQDGLACTWGDGCDAKGACQGGKVTCDDSNACTKDSCDATGACQFVPIAGCGGFCQFSVDCDDDNPCTDDVCIDGACGHAFHSKPCVAGAGCTIGDVCAFGKCVPGEAVGVSTLTGAGVAGLIDDAAELARFDNPQGICRDGAGGFVIADTNNHVLRLVKADGSAATLAGGAKAAGYAEGDATAARFVAPRAVALGLDGSTIWIADTGNHRIRRLTAGKVSLVAGNGYTHGTDGQGAAASFHTPADLAVDALGVAWVVETGRHRVRRVHANGEVLAVAGGSGVAGLVDGPGANARFAAPEGIAAAPGGVLYIADTGNHAIRKLDAKLVVSTVAGGGSKGYLDEAGKLARFDSPAGLALDGLGRLVIVDRGNAKIRRMAPNTLVLTLAGTSAGFGDGLSDVAKLSTGMRAVAVAPTGTVVLTDAGNHRIRAIRDSKGACKIAGACWSAGVANPAAPCEACQADKNDAVFTPAAVSTTCDDGNPCTLDEACNAKGACAGTAKVCDDGDKCTTDACDPKSGECKTAPVVGCGGNCVGDGDCNDGNVCTDDGCVAGKCKAGYNTKDCSGGSACGTGAKCQLGTCQTGDADWIEPLAGSGYSGYADGEAALAWFKTPGDLVAMPDGTVFIADAGNHRIRKLATDGKVSTLAGSGSAGGTDGAGKNATFHSPLGIALAPSGDLWVLDTDGHRIRVVKGDGSVSTLAGDGYAGTTDGAGAAARLYSPRAVAFGPDGAGYVADRDSSRIRRVTAAGVVSTYAGTSAGYINGAAAVARFYGPTGLAMREDKVLYVADYYNNCLRVVAADTSVGDFAGVCGYGKQGYADGPVGTAKFSGPNDLGLDAGGRLYVMDNGNRRLRRIDNSVVTTVAGSGASGGALGPALQSSFKDPIALEIDPFGNVLLGDQAGNTFRRLRMPKGACAIAGVCYAAGVRKPGAPCLHCDAGQATDAWSKAKAGTACSDGKLCTSDDICASDSTCAGKDKVCDDSDKCTTDSCNTASGQCKFAPIMGCGGNCSDPAHCEDGNACTNDACSNGKCVLTPNSAPCDAGVACSKNDACTGGACKAGLGVAVASLAGSGVAGDNDGPAALAQFSSPHGIIRRASDGAVFVADRSNHRVRRISGAGTVSTIAGSSYGFADGTLLSAKFYQPTDLGLKADGTILVTDYYNHRLRVVSASAGVSTLAGSGGAGNKDGKGAAAQLYYPMGIDVLGDGTAFFVEHNGCLVRRVSADGVVLTIAGSFSGCAFADGDGALARFSFPTDIALAPSGDLFVVDNYNHRIRKIAPNGKVSTMAGQAPGFADGQGSSAKFTYPHGIVVDPAGRLLVTDSNNQRIRLIDPATAQVTTLASGLGQLRGIAVNAQGTMFVADSNGHAIRSVHDPKDNCSIAGVCWIDGMPNPANTCQRCDVATSSKGWSGIGVGQACDDGKACDIGEACDKDGACTGGKAKDCNDKDDCTTDSCDAVTGACKNVPISGCF